MEGRGGFLRAQRGHAAMPCRHCIQAGYPDGGVLFLCVFFSCGRTTARRYEDAHHSVWCLLLQLGKKGLFANGRWSETPLFALALCNHTLSGWKETGGRWRAQNAKGQAVNTRGEEVGKRAAWLAVLSCHTAGCATVSPVVSWRAQKLGGIRAAGCRLGDTDGESRSCQGSQQMGRVTRTSGSILFGPWGTAETRVDPVVPRHMRCCQTRTRVRRNGGLQG